MCARGAMFKVDRMVSVQLTLCVLAQTVDIRKPVLTRRYWGLNMILAWIRVAIARAYVKKQERN